MKIVNIVGARPNFVKIAPVLLVPTVRIALTESGGLQEETTVLGVPCLTLRENTERPVAVTHGTNRVGGHHRHESQQRRRAFSTILRRQRLARRYGTVILRSES